MGTARMNYDNETHEEGKKQDVLPNLIHLGKKSGMSMDRSKVGTKHKKKTRRLSLPNENAIIINILLYYFIRYGKNSMKFN